MRRNIKDKRSEQTREEKINSKQKKPRGKEMKARSEKRMQIIETVIGGEKAESSSWSQRSLISFLSFFSPTWLPSLDSLLCVALYSFTTASLSLPNLAPCAVC